MTINGWLQIAIFCAVVLALVKPLGFYMTRVFSGERTFLSPVLAPVERGLYRMAGIDERQEQHWLAYTIAMLLARMRTALRHRIQVQGERPVFRVGELSVDLVRRIVRMGDREVKLTPKEYETLRVLVHHAGKVLTHAYLLREVWGGVADTQYLRVYVRQLRAKLEPVPDRPEYILTETGVGYRMRAPD